MQTFKNTGFTKRDHECTNIVACRASQAPARSPFGAIQWMPCDESIIDGLTMIERCAGVEYWGYL